MSSRVGGIDGDRLRMKSITYLDVIRNIKNQVISPEKARKCRWIRIFTESDISAGDLPNSPITTSHEKPLRTTRAHSQISG